MLEIFTRVLARKFFVEWGVSMSKNLLDLMNSMRKFYICLFSRFLCDLSGCFVTKVHNVLSLKCRHHIAVMFVLQNN